MSYLHKTNTAKSVSNYISTAERKPCDEWSTDPQSRWEERKRLRARVHYEPKQTNRNQTKNDRFYRYIHK
jgi:hypothetical protein